MNETKRYPRELLNLPVYTNMKRDPPTVSAEDRISTVIDIMTGEDIGGVIVVEDHRPVGILTERDLLERVIKSTKRVEQTVVRDIMSKPAITVDAEESIGDALTIMEKNNIRRLIVTKNGILVGLTTERRLLEIACAKYIQESYGAVRGSIYDYASRIGVAYVSTFPPRECGIATYTEDLVGAVSRLRVLKSPLVVAINAKGGYYNYPDEVGFQIDSDDNESYIRAADHLNQDPNVDIVNIQHEYGIFGGNWGDYLVAFLDRLAKPVVTTLHTVLENPPPEAREILKRILKRSNKAVVMARIGIQILEQIYQSFADKVRYIPHGCPNVPHVATGLLKQKLGLESRIVLSTFGLLSPGKGIEYSIEALPELAKQYPEILYLVIGETHPEVRKREGEAYRKQLIDLVDSAGLNKNVRFVNRFLARNELLRYIQATDIYIVPYPNREQISSGTLLYALSAGKAIVSTPFLHAQEVISEGCALECEFKKPTSITESVMMLLKDPELRRKLESNAYQLSRGMIWPNVAMQYVNLFHQVLGLR